MAIGDKVPIPEENAFGTKGEIRGREDVVGLDDVVVVARRDSGGDQQEECEDRYRTAAGPAA